MNMQSHTIIDSSLGDKEFAEKDAVSATNVEEGGGQSVSNKDLPCTPVFGLPTL